MMRRHGHPILGAIVGFFLFFFIGLDLMLFGVIDTYSNLVTILPLVGIVAGFLWGWWSPFRRKRLAKRAMARAEAVTASEPAAPEMAPTPETRADGETPPP